MSNSFKIRPTYLSWGGENFSRGGFAPLVRGLWTSMHHKKTNVFLRTLCTFSIRVWFSKVRSCKPGCAPASPTAHLQYLTARIWRDLSG